MTVQAGPSTQTYEVWETEASLGDTAVVFELSGGSYCSVRVDFSGRMPDTGVIDRIFLVEPTSGSTEWVHLQDDEKMAHVHGSGFIDTRFGGSFVWATFTEWGFPGDATFTIAAPDLQPWPSHLQDEWGDGAPMGKYSIRVQFQCNSGFEVDLKAGHDPEILSMRSIESGIGASSPFANGVLLSETARSFAEPEVRLRAGTDGAEAGRMSLTGPSVAEDWLLHPGSPRFLSADGGSGDYLLQLDRAEASGDMFWALLTGLEPVEGFDDLTA